MEYTLREIVDTVYPYRKVMIVCMETAADMLGLSDGHLCSDGIQVYSNLQLVPPGFKVMYESDCFSIKRYVKLHGIYCTTVEQTLLDMLEHEKKVDIQALIESLSNYYYKHKGSFSNLEAEMNGIQAQAFKKWKNDAIDYCSG